MSGEKGDVEQNVDVGGEGVCRRRWVRCNKALSFLFVVIVVYLPNVICMLY
jgi:hypothetical protein